MSSIWEFRLYFGASTQIGPSNYLLLSLYCETIICVPFRFAKIWLYQYLFLFIHKLMNHQ